VDAWPATPLEPLPPRILLYDGACGLCAGAVRWALRRDRDRRLWFAPLQGSTAARLRALHPGIPSGLETAVLVEEGRVHLRSRALLAVAALLPPPWRWLAPLRRLPAAVADPVYRLLARLRHRLARGSAACPAPGEAERDRLLP